MAGWWPEDLQEGFWARGATRAMFEAGLDLDTLQKTGRPLQWGQLYLEKKGCDEGGTGAGL